MKFMDFVETCSYSKTKTKSKNALSRHYLNNDLTIHSIVELYNQKQTEMIDVFDVKTFFLW